MICYDYCTRRSSICQYFYYSWYADADGPKAFQPVSPVGSTFRKLPAETRIHTVPLPGYCGDDLIPTCRPWIIIIVFSVTCNLSYKK